MRGLYRRAGSESTRCLFFRTAFTGDLPARPSLEENVFLVKRYVEVGCQL
jgi:hypothetical protein